MTLADRERGLGPEGEWASHGSSLPQRPTLRKEEPEGDKTHQGFLVLQLGGHPSTDHDDPGMGMLYTEKERKRHSEKSGEGVTPTQIQHTQPLQDQQTSTGEHVNSECMQGAYGILHPGLIP